MRGARVNTKERLTAQLRQHCCGCAQCRLQTPGSAAAAVAALLLQSLLVLGVAVVALTCPRPHLVQQEVGVHLLLHQVAAAGGAV